MGVTNRSCQVDRKGARYEYQQRLGDRENYIILIRNPRGTTGLTVFSSENIKLLLVLLYSRFPPVHYACSSHICYSLSVWDKRVTGICIIAYNFLYDIAIPKMSLRTMRIWHSFLSTILILPSVELVYHGYTNAYNGELETRYILSSK